MGRLKQTDVYNRETKVVVRILNLNSDVENGNDTDVIMVVSNDMIRTT